MTVDKKELVTTIAFLIGVRYNIIETQIGADCPETLQKLNDSQPAKVIRYLSKIRSTLFCKFKKTDSILRYDLKNLDQIEWYDHADIKQLMKWEIPVIQVNTNANAYAQHLTKLISEHIDACSTLFPEWVKWSYIRDLFCIPKYTNTNAMKKEFDLYMKNMDWYPYQLYIHWKPADYGNILYRDGKFLDVIYSQHEDQFDDFTKYRDANAETKNSIYNFVAESERAEIVVDCENSDPYKLYNVLRNLDPTELAKIEKIVLYDDYHTTSAWDMIGRYTAIPVEHIVVERVTDRKSLVDIKMTAGVCNNYHVDNIDSFILFSSDSDYWGLITSLPRAKFLVMYEYSKCGKAIKDAMAEHGIYYCAIDDFCSGNVESFKRAVLFDLLEKYLADIVYLNGKALVEQIYTEARLDATPKEKEAFFQKYICTLQLKCSPDGQFSVEIKGNTAQSWC